MKPLAFILLCFGCEPTVAPSGAEGRGDPEREALDNEYRRLTRRYNETTGASLLSVDDVMGRLDSGHPVVLLDVREPEEHRVSSLPGARLLPPSKVAEAKLELPPEATVVTYCTAGYRSGIAAVELAKRTGRPVYNLDGGIIAWFNAGGEVRNPSGQKVDTIHPYGKEWAKYVHPRDGAKP